MTKSNFKFYDIRHLFKDHPDALYYVSFGERSNGKTYSALDYGMERFAKNGEEFAYIRRWGEDIRPKNIGNLFKGHIENGRLQHYFGDTYNALEYKSNKFVLLRRKEDGKVDDSVETKILCNVFDLNGMEHYKSISFPRITTIILDEFISRDSYLSNEFQLFQNSVSTIVRYRNNVRILMLGNTVNKYCPYFNEMGLKHIKEMKEGTVDVYTYGQTGLKVVVEYCESSAKKGGKPSDAYFAFDNPQLKMITEGSWEIAVYPHLPCEYKPKDVSVEFFIEFDRDILHGEVVSTGDQAPFVFLHRKTTKIKHDDDIVYGTSPSSNPYHIFGLLRQNDPLSKFIRECIATGRIFYSTNEVGEVLRNYILWNRNQGLL